MNDEVIVKIGAAHDGTPPEMPPPDTGSDPGAEGGEHTAEPPKDTGTATLAPVQLTSGATAYGKILTINCADCGRPRTIKPQDAFQVKRCPDCQKKFRNTQRSEARKAKRQAAKQEATATE